MNSVTQHEASSHDPELGDAVWTPQTWVYAVWVVMGNRLFCKIGYSTNPSSRFGQIIGGIPERPFRIHLLPCLNVTQAKVFEAMLHNNLRKFRTKGEWFAHHNAKHLYQKVADEMGGLLALFESFGHDNDFQQINLDGKQPIVRSNGLIAFTSD